MNWLAFFSVLGIFCVACLTAVVVWLWLALGDRIQRRYGKGWAATVYAVGSLVIGAATLAGLFIP